MKLLIASDLHGSYFYCQKLIDLFQEEKADYLILLGDILYHGPRNPLPFDYNPKKVYELLNSYSHNIIAIKGNCDSEVDEMVLEFPLPNEKRLQFFNKEIYLTHGHHINPCKYPTTKVADLIFYGHSHVPGITECKDMIFVNPGSISMPKENYGCSYAIIDEKNIIIKTLEQQVIFKKNL